MTTAQLEPRTVNDLLLVMAGAITATLTICAAVWWIIRPRWDEGLIAAARRRAPDWKRFYEELFAVELRTNADTHERARRTHDLMEQHIEDFTDFRRRVEPKIADMVIFTKTVADLDVSVNRLNDTLNKINDAVHETREQVAELRGQLGG